MKKRNICKQIIQNDETNNHNGEIHLSILLYEYNNQVYIHRENLYVLMIFDDERKANKTMNKRTNEFRIFNLGKHG